MKTSISTNVLNMATAFTTANDTLKDATKKRTTAKENFYIALFEDYTKNHNEQNVTDALHVPFTKGYFDILDSKLLLSDEDVALQNMVTTAKKVLLKNLFTFEHGFISSMVKIIDLMDYVKTTNQIKKAKKSESKKEYTKKLNKVVRRALKRRDAYELIVATDMTKTLKKMSYVKLLQVAKVAKILANHKMDVYKK